LSANLYKTNSLCRQIFLYLPVQNTINLIENTANFEIKYKNCTRYELPFAIDYLKSKSSNIKPTNEAFEIMSESIAVVMANVFMNVYLGEDTT